MCRKGRSADACASAAESFFPEQRPRPVERPAVEEPDTAVIGLERTVGDASLTQGEQVAAHLCLAQLVGRSPKVSSEVTHGLDVDGLSSRHQPCQRHVFDHLCT